MMRPIVGWIAGLALAAILAIVLRPGFGVTVGLVWGVSLAGLIIAAALVDD